MCKHWRASYICDVNFNRMRWSYKTMKNRVERGNWWRKSKIKNISSRSATNFYEKVNKPSENGRKFHIHFDSIFYLINYSIFSEIFTFFVFFQFPTKTQVEKMMINVYWKESRLLQKIIIYPVLWEKEINAFYLCELTTKRINIRPHTKQTVKILRKEDNNIHYKSFGDLILNNLR